MVTKMEPRYLLMVLCTFLSSSVLCDECSKCSCNNEYPFFVQLGSGYSLPLCTKLCPDPTYWDPANEGYNSKLSHTPVFEVSFGYHITDWAALSASAAYRGVYRYCKYQTVPVVTGVSALAGTKTRYFDLDNMSVMFNCIFNGYDRLALHLCHNMSLAPYVAAGVGVSQNRVFNFHTVRAQVPADPLEQDFNYVSALMNLYVCKYSLAAHVDLGASWRMASIALLNVGYRFYYAGKFQSNNYIMDVELSGPNLQPITAPAWKGTLKANEFFINLTLSF